MRATLIYQLPEEQAEYDLANRAGDLSCALEEILALLRSEYKYRTDLSPEQEAYLNELREKILAIVNERDLGL